MAEIDGKGKGDDILGSDDLGQGDREAALEQAAAKLAEVEVNSADQIASRLFLRPDDGRGKSAYQGASVPGRDDLITRINLVFGGNWGSEGEVIGNGPNFTWTYLGNPFVKEGSVDWPEGGYPEMADVRLPSAEGVGVEAGDFISFEEVVARVARPDELVIDGITGRIDAAATFKNIADTVTRKGTEK